MLTIYAKPADKKLHMTIGWNTENIFNINLFIVVGQMIYHANIHEGTHRRTVFDFDRTRSIRYTGNGYQRLT